MFHKLKPNGNDQGGEWVQVCRACGRAYPASDGARAGVCSTCGCWMQADELVWRPLSNQAHQGNDQGNQ